jgi:hypothetical protein
MIIFFTNFIFSRGAFPYNPFSSRSSNYYNCEGIEINKSYTIFAFLRV